MKATNERKFEPIAIIGIGSIFPGAVDPDEYWANIREARDLLSGIPETHWKVKDYFSEDQKSPDMTYGKTGGFISPMDFNPMEYAITPRDLEATDTSQLLGLIAARRALESAGYGRDRDFDRKRTSVILGVTGTLELVVPLGARLGHPFWKKALREAGASEEIVKRVTDRIAGFYPQWQETSFPGLLGNVVAGRIANQMDLGGTNCVVDAACASSLSAVHMAIMELNSGKSDMAITGGVDTFNDIFMFMCFSKTPALSTSGHARPFDQKADGTVLGEGVGMIVLKRLKDAQKAGDRIFAVIRGMGSASDGKGAAVFAPQSGGQKNALIEAYQTAGVSPSTVELMEAHGTGTRVGDVIELDSMTGVYSEATDKKRFCALGSVKSQIGHAKAAAGVAGLIKVALSLYYKVLPPTAKVEMPLEPLLSGDSPFYVNTVKRPWLSPGEHPRRGAVSAFGFGGSNFHGILEEAEPEKKSADWDGKIEIIALSADNIAGIKSELNSLVNLEEWKEISDKAVELRNKFDPSRNFRLVMALEEGQKAPKKVFESALNLLDRNGEKKAWSTPDGIYFGAGKPENPPCVLFPGQGCQYVGMLRDMACQFPEFLATLESASASFDENRGEGIAERLSDLIYPVPVFDEDSRKRQSARLTDTRVAQPAIGAVSLGAWRVLQEFGVSAMAFAGHSYGELTALSCAGRLKSDEFHRLSALRGNLMAGNSGDLGSMLAVQAGVERIQKILEDNSLDLIIANRNAPEQSVLSGRTDEILRAETIMKNEGINCKKLPVSAGFHSSLIANAQVPFANALKKIAFPAGKVTVFSNTTGGKYPEKPEEARRLLSGQLASPVNFVDEIKNIYDSGVRVFLEVGPGARMTGLVKAILSDMPDYEAIALDASAGKKNGIFDLARTLSSLSALGYGLELEKWNPRKTVDSSGKPEAKPKFSVKICGANYISPERRARMSSTVDNRLPGGFEHGVKAPAGEVKVMNEKSSNQNGSALGEALQITRQNMAILQNIQEQTASLHRQFLETQEMAVRNFQGLMAQQQALIVSMQGGTVPEIPVLRMPEPVPVQIPSLPYVQKAQDTQNVQIPLIKSAPVNNAIQESTYSAPSSPGVDTSEALLSVVSEKTGYPADMLDMDMSLDSDLGIDSIKRVEIFSALKDRVPHLPMVGPDQIGSLKTLRDIMGFMGNSVDSNPPAQSSVSGSSTGVDFSDALLSVVSEKTGYPADMLDMDMSLDSDLGIDSIKRVEIFSALKDRVPHLPMVGPDQIGSLKTLRDIMGFMVGGNGSGKQKTEDVKKKSISRLNTGEDLNSSVEKMVPVAKALDPFILRESIRLENGALIAVAGEESPLCLSLIDSLKKAGYKVYFADMKSDVESIPVSDDVRGFVLISPLEPVDSFYLKSLSLLQKMAVPLRRNAGSGDTFFVTISSMDGMFGFSEGMDQFDPHSGGLAGLSKTAGMEWPEVICRAIDIPRNSAPSSIADSVTAEILKKSPREAGVSENGIFTLNLLPSPAAPADTGRFPLEGNEVLLITGGGRGVTGACALHIARRIPADKLPKIVLMGRSPEPSPEPAWLAPLEDEAEIKRELMKNTPRKMSPRELGEIYRRAMANRELLKTLSDVRETGAQVHYVSADVSDPEKMAEVIREIHSRFGPVRGLIHGAGVLADKLIIDKKPEEFKKVYDTKVRGLDNILKALEDEPLKAVVLFSSSTGRFGRAGQSDYAVSNEILNKTAHSLKMKISDCRVVSVNWGPWDGGMVTPALKKLFQEEGVGIIPISSGAEYLLSEMCADPVNPVETVLLGKIGIECSEMKHLFEISLSPARNPFLRDHVIGGKSVLPMAMMAEIFLQSLKEAENEDFRLEGIEDLRVLEGLKMASSDEVRIEVMAGDWENRNGKYFIPLEMSYTDKIGNRHKIAGVMAVFSKGEPEVKPLPVDIELEKYPLNVDIAYSKHLFHGSFLKGIKEIAGCSEKGMRAVLKNAGSVSSWFGGSPWMSWQADPMVLDCSFQAMILWSCEVKGVPSLPTGFDSFMNFSGSFPAETEMTVHIREHTGTSAMADIYFTDGKGILLAVMEGYHCVMDPSLKSAFTCV